MLKATINCKGFIIPNPTYKANNYAISYVRDEAIKACELNGIDHENEQMLQLWMTNDQCDNISDHTFKFATDEPNQEVRHCFPGEIPNLVPSSLFKGKDDGDVVTYKWQCHCNDMDVKKRDWDNMGDEIEFTFNITLAQKEFRYRSKSFKEFFDELIQ